MDELEFEEEAVPTVVEDRIFYKASVAGFPVSAAATMEALAKLWPAAEIPKGPGLLNGFDGLHADASASIVAAADTGNPATDAL
jgi:hypothetical protein